MENGQKILITNKALNTITGSIERVTYHNNNNGFCVLRIKSRSQHDLITVIGYTASVTAGEYIECTGEWHNDKNHGLQFKATELKIIQPSTLEGMEKYLGSGLVKGIGPGFAKKLVQAFGLQVFDIIENSPHKLTELDGIGDIRKAKITSAWSQQKKIRDIIVFLQTYGVGTARAVRIYKTYGDHAIDKIKQNPYCLASDIHGIGFRTADALAMRLGIPKDSIIRAQAGINYILQEYCAKGHCATLTMDLIKTATEILEIEQHIILQAIEQEIKNKNLILDNFENNQPGLFLIGFYKAELSVAEKIKILQNTNTTNWQKVNITSIIPWVETENNIILSQSQRAAIQLAITSKVVIITGGPGVGKTTVVNSILKIINRHSKKILLAAPTGRAAKRLAESTCMEAKTLHRLLAYDPKLHGFKHNESNPLDAELLVVDEMSMVDILMMNNLLKALPATCALILVGDVDQLPSVGPGCVLSDMIKSNIIPTIKLTEIFRQAASSQIIINAHRINNGNMPKLKYINKNTDFYFAPAETVEELQYKLIKIVSERIPKNFNLDPIKQIQILAPMNRGNLGARSLNIELKKALNQSYSPDKEITRYGTSFSVGDKVIQTVNNYNKEIFNGDIGFIKAIDLEESQLLIDFDGKNIIYDFDELDEIALAYAITIHKSQGSEYPAVVIPLATQHFSLLERNLLYTGVTRGKKLVVIVGQIKAIAMAVKKTISQQRLTKLTDRLLII